MPEVPAWLWLVPVTTFVGLEAWALASKGEPDTASSVIRRLAGVEPRRPWRPVGIAVIVGGCAWLAVHLTTDLI